MKRGEGLTDIELTANIGGAKAVIIVDDDVQCCGYWKDRNRCREAAGNGQMHDSLALEDKYQGHKTKDLSQFFPRKVIAAACRNSFV